MNNANCVRNTERRCGKGERLQYSWWLVCGEVFCFVQIFEKQESQQEMQPCSWLPPKLSVSEILFYMRCWIRTLAHDICFDPDSGSSLFLKVKNLFFFFFCFDAPSSSCTFFVKIYQYNRIIINSSFNSSFRIPKWWGLQNAKKNHIDFFKQTNCNNPWINTTTERKLNLR